MAGAPTDTATTTTSAPTDRAALKAALEATKGEFRDLLAQIRDDDWAKPTANAAWSVRELTFHLANSQFVAQVAEGAAKPGGGGFNPLSLLPRGILDRLSVFYVRRGAKKATRESMIERYDAGIDRTTAAIDKVADNDWSREVKTFDQMRTVAYVFQLSVEHMNEHAPEIRTAIGH
jgi:hypothetical protein